jgi:hypothetical protein
LRHCPCPRRHLVRSIALGSTGWGRPMPRIGQSRRAKCSYRQQPERCDASVHVANHVELPIWQNCVWRAGLPLGHAREVLRHRANSGEAGSARVGQSSRPAPTNRSIEVVTRCKDFCDMTTQETTTTRGRHLSCAP